MISVGVRLPAVLRPLAGGEERVAVEVAEPATVGTVFAALGAAHPALRRRVTDDRGALRRHVNVYLAEVNVRDLDDLRTPVSDGDDLLVLPAISGG